MIIFPAIDILGGQVVRLTQGDYERRKVYAEKPAAVAKGFLGEGARYLHVVDLDGAKYGTAVNFDAIREIVELGGLFVEVGGGIRDEARIAQYLAIGVGRVILGTAAIRNYPFVVEMAKKYGEKIAVGVDARDGFVAVGGWLETTNVPSVAFCAHLAKDGVRTVVYTDIARDGALRGANTHVYAELVQIPNLRVIASGGVSSEHDITALRAAGVPAAIVGKALYEGRLTLKRAIELGAGETLC